HLHVPARVLAAFAGKHVVPGHLRRQRRGPPRPFSLSGFLLGLRAGCNPHPLTLQPSLECSKSRRQRRHCRGAGRVLPPLRVRTWFGFLILWLPAWLVLGYWFVIQFLSGAAGSITIANQRGGVAFWAHVGGFLTGMALIKVLPIRKQSYAFEEE